MALQKLFRILFVLACCSSVAMMGHRHHHGSRARCPKCPPGSGVLSKCDKTMSTVCGLCINGTYSSLSSSSSPCLPCSRCGEGLYVAHLCLPTRDTICDSCHTYRGPHNEDYIRRCTSGNAENSRQDADVFVNVNTKESDTKLSSSDRIEFQFKANSTYALPPIQDIYTDITHYSEKAGTLFVKNFTTNTGVGACNFSHGCGSISSSPTPNQIVSHLVTTLSAAILCGFLLIAICMSCFIIKGSHGRDYKVVATVEDV